MAVALAACCFLIGGGPARAQDTPEGLLAEATSIRSQKGIKVIGHLRIDTRIGYHGMWHLRHSPKRFGTLSAQVGLHPCKKGESAWRRDDVINEFHLEASSLARYLEFCGRDPAEYVLVSPDRRESYYFATVF